MATATSYTQERIAELLSGWEGVATEQAGQEAIIQSLKNALDLHEVNLNQWNNLVLPQLEAELGASSDALANLSSELLTMRGELDSKMLILDEFNTIDLPELQASVDANAAWAHGFEDITVPDLIERLEVVESSTGTVDLTEVNNKIAALRDKFPIEAADISAGTITANEIAAHTITALQIAADSITAVEIAAGSITANEIASHTITSAEIFAGTITSLEIQSRSIKAVNIGAREITANEIAADTITANEIGADAITANEIAAGAVVARNIFAGAVTTEALAANSITGDKIQANSINVSKLIVSDLTNLALDGEFEDPTMEMWDLGIGAYLIRVQSVDGLYYGQVDGQPSRHSYFHNKNRFAIKPGEQYYLSMEVWTPSTNVEDIQFTAAMEVLDVDGVSHLWRPIKEGAVVIAPGTNWAPVQGSIFIDDETLFVGFFNSYIAPTTNANQLFGVRKISLRKRFGGDLIVDGSITGVKLDADSVSSAVVNTGILQSQLTITGLLSIADSNAGWSASEGLWLGDQVHFYSDGRANRVESDLITSSVTVKTGLSIGGNADVSGVVTVSNGVTAPTARMSLSQTWPKRPNDAGMGGSNNSADEASVWQSMMEWNATQWVIPYNSFGAGFRLVNKSNLSWGGDLDCGSWADDFYPFGSGAMLGGSMYVIGSDRSRNGDNYIYKVSTSSTIYKQAERRINMMDAFKMKRIRLVTDGTKIGMIYVQTTTNSLRLKWYDAGDLSTIGSEVVLISSMAPDHIGGAYIGPTYDGGPSRLIVSMFSGDSNTVRSWSNTGGTRYAAEDWPKASGATICGLTYDPSQKRMVSFDKYGNFYTYSKYRDGGTLNSQYTFYDGDNANYPAGTIIGGVNKDGQASGAHETPPSPQTSFTLSKRAWPTITAPPALHELVTDVTQVDKANRLGVYASVNDNPRFQAYLPVGTRTLPLTDELSTSGYLAGASPVPSFATAMVPAPGRLRSSAVQGPLPTWFLDGGGAGRMGHNRWGEDGRPLNYAIYRSATVQACPSGAQTTRTGFAQTSPTGAPTNGISYTAGKFTVSQSGLYFVTGTVTTGAVTTTNGRKLTIIAYNGEPWFRTESHFSGASGEVGGCVSGMLYMNAGDTVEIRGYQNSGSSVNFTTVDEANYIGIYCLAAY